MALDRFKALLQSTPEIDSANPSPAIQVDAHGPQTSPGFVPAFVRKHWKKAALGLAAGMTALSMGVALDGPSTVAPMMNDGTTANAVYQSFEKTVHARAMHQQQQDIEAVLKHARAIGILKTVPEVQLSYYNNNSSYEHTNPDLSCSIHLYVDEHGRMMDEDITHGGKMADDALGHEHRDSVSGHEAAHCQFDREMAPFRHSGLSAATEKTINDWVIGPAAGDNPMRSEFNETQADLLGKMIMLEKNHFSDAAWAEVKQTYEGRRATQAAEESHQSDIENDPHNTAAGLRLLLDHRQEVERLAPGQYTDYAYGLASQSLLANLNGQRSIPEAHGPGHAQGPEGYTRLTNQMNLFGMRAAVVEQVLQLQEEKLGLRVHKAGLENTEPRRLAEEWMAKDNPFTGNVVTFTQGKNGSIDRHWVSDDAQDRFVDDPGPLQMRDRASLARLRDGFHWRQVETELSTALNVPGQAPVPVAPTVAPVASSSSASIQVDKATPTVTMAASTASNVAPARLPARKDLGPRLDARTVSAPVVVLSTVQRSRSLAP